MLRFLSKLVRQFQTANTARTPRRALRRTLLQLEGLEDRMLLSAASATLHNGILDVKVKQPNEHITFSGAKRPGKLDVFLGKHTLLGQFSRAAVTQTRVSLKSLDTVTVDYGHGDPFQSDTGVFFTGSGSDNTLTLKGSLAGNVDESFIGGIGAQGGQLDLDHVEFSLSPTIGSVIDKVATTGTLHVQSSGGQVTLTGSDGLTQTLSGLNPIKGGAANSFTFSNKSSVELDLANEVVGANNAGSAVLQATAAAAGEQSFTVNLQGSSQFVSIEATPRTGTTNVSVSGLNDDVDLLGNLAPVSITGDFSTSVDVVPSLHSAIVSGIQANVTVAGAGTLIIANEFNTTTPENVTVTEKTVSGNLFGNPSVQVNYSNVGILKLVTGVLTTGPQESYTIEGSSPSAILASQIDLTNNAPAGLNVQVSLTASSGLAMKVDNGDGNPVGAADLLVHAPGATFHLAQSTPGGSGQDTATFGAQNPSSNIQFTADGGPVNVFNSNIEKL
jgi:hypothetical protein